MSFFFFFECVQLGGLCAFLNPPNRLFGNSYKRKKIKGLLNRPYKEDLVRFTFFLTCSNELGRCALKRKSYSGSWARHVSLNPPPHASNQVKTDAFVKYSSMAVNN